MKICPTCREEYAHEFSYCTFDGAKLKKQPRQKKSGANYSKPRAAKPSTVKTIALRPASRVNFGKTGLYSLLAVVFLGSSVIAVLTLVRKDTKSSQPLKLVMSTAQPATIEEARPAEEVKPATILAEMPRENLLKLMPQNLLRRFHAGERLQGTPDDMRVIKSEKGEYAVLIGSGGADRDSRAPAKRLLALLYDGQQFVDVTSSILPPPLSRGIITGLRSDLKFESQGLNLLARVVASSGLAGECATCDRAYQQVTLEWKDSRYVESKRIWNNDPYTAFYATVEALEKRRVDARSRQIVDESLAGEIYLGFSRNGNQPWTVQPIGDSDSADRASYEISNGSERLIITVAKENDRWRAVRVDRKGSVS